MFHGRSVAEAAKSLQVAQTTVKCHLKELFGQTGESTGPAFVSVGQPAGERIRTTAAQERTGHATARLLAREGL